MKLSGSMKIKMSSIMTMRYSVLASSILNIAFIILVYDVYNRYQPASEDCKRVAQQVDDDTCVDLLTDGRYIDVNGNETWHPYHCTMHYYTVK